VSELVTEQRTVPWSEATWLNPPAAAEPDGADLVVTTRDRSDFWRTTSYGFVRDSGHALLTAFPAGSAVEVGFVAEFDTLFDQAGIMVRVDPSTWLKAGIELSDGFPQLGAVVTHGSSDWSLAPVPEWRGHRVTLRASRSGDAVTIRARRDEEPWRMVRLAPLSPDATAMAGPFCCSPERAGLRVRFTGFTVGPADAGLHTEQ
jgi:regulation of enolase protein 1 (concanavalin A-like superfamily)